MAMDGACFSMISINPAFDLPRGDVTTVQSYRGEIAAPNAPAVQADDVGAAIIPERRPVTEHHLCIERPPARRVEPRYQPVALGAGRTRVQVIQRTGCGHVAHAREGV